ncbi:trimeric intracellular cation channel family protein [Croceimicrobium sp.]|uniref:trimeric intracellular cation channel family protein n=1 Tax=Croceimicrobium sp. TaxID=2828340 RepID=UPI003BAB024F
MSYLRGMPLQDLIYVLDLLGTLVFAISGVVAAVERKFDLVGAFIIGFVTALGGGTTRDVLMGATPVSWMLNLEYLGIVALAMILCYLFYPRLSHIRRSLFIFDSIGLGLFTILGFQKAMIAELSIPIALMLGIVSAVFGGVIRDVLTNQVPLIFRKEIYALASLAGGLLYWLGSLLEVNTALNALISICVVVLIRSLAVAYGWESPFLPLGRKEH